MKISILLSLLMLAVLPGCSLFERDIQELEAMESQEPPFDPEEAKNSLVGQLNPDIPDSTTVASSSSEAEISRLQTKVAALETKVDVLTASLEKVQMLRSQPVIEAASPEPNLAAPVASSASGVEENHMEVDGPVVSSAPSRPFQTNVVARSDSPAQSGVGAEREFRSAMDLFQSGKNMEASVKFTMMAKKFPRHLLAGHALYWAGESAARAKQWSVAMENWEAVEKNYPRSTYVPETLVGLAKAYETQGDANKALYYRELVRKSFPQSPVVLSLQMKSSVSSKAAAPAPSTGSDEDFPEYSESTDESNAE